MSPSRGDVGQLSLYLVGTGVLGVAVSWATLRLADRALGLSLRLKAFVTAFTGTGVALLNVFIIARLMFLSTDHDLPLLAAILLFAAVITALLSLWVAQSATAGLRRLAEGAQALAGGNYDVRVDAVSRDEVGNLTASFNEMAERLQHAENLRAELDRERRHLTMAISHDLRTPVASLQAMVEALNDEVVTEPAEVSRYHEAMLRELKRLDSLMNDLFELAQIESGAVRLQRRSVRLAQVAAEAVDAMQVLARRKQVSITLARGNDVPPLRLDQARISRVLLNLLENALNHTPAGGRIQTRVERNGAAAIVRVSDTGEGISPDDLPHIWKPFYRGEKSRRRSGEAGGTGLGLSIVKGLVEAHGGIVVASSRPGKGTEVTITLPFSGTQRPNGRPHPQDPDSGDRQ
jgi:signal transduction histidine kinase